MNRKLIIAMALIAVILAGASALLWTGYAVNAGPPGAPAHVGVAVPPASNLGSQYIPNLQCTLSVTNEQDFANQTKATTWANESTFPALASYSGLALSFGDVPTSSIHADGFDEYFRLDNATVGASYKVEAIPDYTTNYNLGIIVYNLSKTSIHTDINPADNNRAAVTFLTDSIGPYYVRVVQLTQYCTGLTYRLRVTFNPPTPTATSTATPTPGAGNAQDSFEPNEDINSATPLNSNSYTGLTLYNTVYTVPSDDKDWYSIFVGASQVGIQYTINFVSDGNLPIMDLDIYNPSRALLAQRLGSNNLSYTWTPTVAGAYYFYLRRSAGSPSTGLSTYHVTWSSTGPTPTLIPLPLLDACEPNETISAARPLNQGNITGLTLFNPYLYPSDPGQDQDWYSIFVNVPQMGSRYVVNAVSDNLCPAMDMDIRNPNTDLIGQVFNSNTLSFSWIADKAGAYYIYVRRAANSAPCFGTYRLSWTVTRPAPPVSAFDASRHSGSPPLAIWFTDQSSGVITEWLWNFGDGFTSALRNPLHVYAASGVYTVALTVSGPGGSNTLALSNYIHAYLPQPVLSAPVCGTTNKMALTIRGVAQYGLNITLYDNGAQLLTTSAASNNAFTFAPSLGSGQHIFTATASNVTETSLPSYPLALTISPTLAYDPVGVTFSYGTQWGAITEHPRDLSGCANPDGWRIWLRPWYTTVVVPVRYAQSAIVTITLGDQTRVVATRVLDPLGTLHLPLTAAFAPPIRSGTFAITVTADGQTSAATGSAVIDSDGYVYDKNVWDSQGITQTLAGVTVTCEYSDTAANEWLMWPAWAFDNQVNPQLTDAGGNYTFFVPPGTYRLTTSHPDYWPYHSPDLVVVDTPARLNIPLVLMRRMYLPIIFRNP